MTVKHFVSTLETNIGRMYSIEYISVKNVHESNILKDFSVTVHHDITGIHNHKFNFNLQIRMKRLIMNQLLNRSSHTRSAQEHNILMQLVSENILQMKKKERSRRRRSGYWLLLHSWDRPLPTH